VLCELRPGVSRAVVEQAVREEIAALVENGVDKKNLQRIRTQIRASFLFQDESVLDMAMKLGRFEAAAPEGYRTLASVLPTYESLTQKELREVAARYLSFHRAAVVWAIPAADGVPDDKRSLRGKGKKRGKVAKVRSVRKAKKAVSNRVTTKVKKKQKRGGKR
jgi:zinc protease